MKLNGVDETGRSPDYDTLRKMVLDYRIFAGTTAAFHIEYLWWPGQFDTKEEELDFHLNEFARPDDYEVVSRWHEEAVDNFSAAQGELDETRTSRNFWRVVAIVLLVPYLVIWYLW